MSEVICDISSSKCSKCGEIKSVSCFHASSASSSGLQSWCKACNKTRSRNKEYVYYKCEICGGLFKRVKRSSKAEDTRTRKCNSCARRNYIDNNGGHSWNYSGSEYFAGRQIAKWKSSAKRRGHEWSLTKSQLDDIFNSQKGICALSGITMTAEITSIYRVSIDRVDSSIGYVFGNVQFVCSIVNIMKNKFSEDVFIAVCESVVRNKGVL